MSFPKVELRRLSTIANGGTPTPDATNWDGGVPWATPVDLGRVNGRTLTATERTLTRAGALSGSTLVPAGSVILSTRAPIGYTAIAGIAIAFNQGCKALLPYHGVDGRYLRYAVESTERSLMALGRGSTFLEVNSADLASHRVPAAPSTAQRQIADYLDHETAEIDAFITDLATARGLAAEQFTAMRADLLQTHAGSSRSLRRFVDYVTSGSRGWGDLLGDEGDPFVRITNIPRDALDVLTNDLRRVQGVEREEGARARIEIGDVLMSITADLGSVAVAGPEVAGGYTSQHVALVRPDRSLCDSRYLAHALLAPTTKSQIAEKSYGGTKIQLSLADVRDLAVPFPPLEAQIGLRRAMDSAQADRDEQVVDIDAAIALAKERRAALITAAVTGQIDVTSRQRPVVDSIQSALQEAR